MNDSESMLAEYRKSQNADVSGGATAFMPIMLMLTATALIDQPPDVSQLSPVPYFVPAVIDEKYVKIRLVAKTVRAQLAFYATNSHDARSVCDQFCTYMQDGFYGIVKLSLPKRKPECEMKRLLASNKSKTAETPSLKYEYQHNRICGT
jgi:hypothetical protein